MRSLTLGGDARTGDSITGDGVETIAELEGLESLTLFGMTLKETDLTCLKALRRLSYLHLVDAKVTKAGIARLAELMPELAVQVEPTPR